MNKNVIFEGKLVHYSTQGRSGTFPLVFLHGFCEDSSIFKDLVEHLLPKRVICIDLPGFGKSSTSANADMAFYSGAVKAVLDQEKCPRCLMVGHSLGGYITLDFARAYEDRLVGFVLLHSHPFADDEVMKTNRQKSIALIQSGKKNAFVAQLFPKLFPSDFISKHGEVLEMCIKSGKKQSAEGIIAATQSMITRKDRTDILRQANIPVQFLLGREDTLIPEEKMRDFIHLPNRAVVNVMNGIGHMGMLEAPALTAQLLLGFYTLVVLPSPVRQSHKHA